MVQLMQEALLEHGGSGRPGFERASEQGRVAAAVSKVYEKLARMPLAVSMALLREGSRDLPRLLPERRQRAVPACLAALEPVTVDGKVIKNVPRRLKILRDLRGMIVGGKIVAAMHNRTGLAVAINADLDGDRQDVPLLEGLLEQVRLVLTGSVLWIGDAAYCNLVVLGKLREGEHFLLRYHRSVGFHRDRSRPVQEGETADGGVWAQEWGWLGGPGDPRRRYVRRINLTLGNGKLVSVVTDLLEEQAYPAAELLAAYRMRGKVETLFQEVSEVFHLRRLIGSTPRAGIFQAAFCLLISNFIQVLRLHAAAAADEPVERLSAEKLFADVRRDLIAWAELTDVASTVQGLQLPLSAAALRQRLSALVTRAFSRRWLKAPPKKNWRRPPRAHYDRSGRTSVQKAMDRATRRPAAAARRRPRPGPQ
jgi:hypothetical protein